MKYFGFLVLLFAGLSHAQNTINIIGLSPIKPGTDVTAERFEDLFTRTMAEIAFTEVKSDSTFELKFTLTEIQKIKISIAGNFCYLYVQPNQSYKIYISNDKISNFNNPLGNQVECSFFDLDSSDINYKILTFDRWIDGFVGENYHLRTKGDSIFLKRLILFENAVTKRFQTDTCSFFKQYIKYRVASLEELNFVGARDERARYTVNIASFTVFYKNDEYMNYIRDFYKNYLDRISDELNNKIYKAILAGSPTKLINLLGEDYRLANVRLRELVMIISLADVYHDKSYPQSRISTILDSVAHHGLFGENKIIAKNTLFKLNQLNSGSLSPAYEFFNIRNENIANGKFAPRYTYIQFITLDQSNCLLQFEMLKQLYTKYSSSVEFITVVLNQSDWNIIEKKLNLKDVPWTVVIPKDHTATKKSFQLSSFPQYVLIDAQGYIVSSNAASPVPDGSYKTIDYYFYQIHKIMMREK